MLNFRQVGRYLKHATQHNIDTLVDPPSDKNLAELYMVG